MDKNHITVERLLYDPSYSSEPTCNGSKFYLPQQYTQTELEWGPDTSRHQTMVIKDREVYPRRIQKGCPRLQDACQIQVQVQDHAYRNRVLPPESLAKSSGCGQRGTLERKCIGSLVDSGSQSIRSILSTKLKIVQKSHLTTRAKLQLRPTHVPLLEIKVEIPGHLSFKRYLGASAAPRESDVNPRPCEMTPSDKNDIPHVVNTTTKSLSNLETVIDILEDPFFEITMRGGLLTVCIEREI